VDWDLLSLLFYCPKINLISSLRQEQQIHFGSYVPNRMGKEYVNKFCLIFHLGSYVPNLKEKEYVNKFCLMQHLAHILIQELVPILVYFFVDSIMMLVAKLNLTNATAVDYLLTYWLCLFLLWIQLRLSFRFLILR
jgi:hypothetical protein